MKLLLAALTLFLAAGCGGSDDSGDSIGSGQELADAIGCADFANDSEEMFVTDGGSCTLEAEDDLTIYYFKDDASRDNWIEVASAFGGESQLEGSNFVVVGDASLLEKIKGKIGGKIS